MGWYRTRSGRLLYGKGGLADVYVSKGYTPVDDAVAEAEVASGEAQTRADVEGELAAEVDARADQAAADAKAAALKPTDEHPVPLPDGTALLVTSSSHRDLTDDELEDVESAIAEETGHGTVRR